MAEACRVDLVDRVVSHIGIKIGSIDHSRWIFTEEPTKCWVVVAVAVIVEPDTCLRVEFTGSEPVGIGQ